MRIERGYNSVQRGSQCKLPLSIAAIASAALAVGWVLGCRHMGHASPVTSPYAGTSDQRESVACHAVSQPF